VLREEEPHDMDDIYAINLAKSRFREGFNLGDEEQILSIYDDEFVDMSFAMPSFYSGDSKDVFRARLKRLFRDYYAELAINIINVVLNGDRAMDRGWHILKLTSKTNSEKLLVRTRYFETWRRDAMKGWLVTSFIDNLDQPPQLPEDLIRELESTSSTAMITRVPDDGSRSAARERSSDVR
jgi:ketosteroid isomerase-like protein